MDQEIKLIRICPSCPRVVIDSYYCSACIKKNVAEWMDHFYKVYNNGVKMRYCKICKKWFKSLGYGRHEMMHVEEVNPPGYVHNGHCRRVRHKCSICGAVRLERFMKKLGWKTRYGHECWTCDDREDNQDKINRWWVY